MTLVHNITDVNDKIYEAAPGASAELAAQATGVVPRGHRRPRARHARPPAEGDRAHPGRSSRSSSSSSSAGFAYPVDGDVYFRVARFPEYGRLSGQRPDQVEEQEPNPLQGGPARLRALEGEQAGRGHRLGLAVGPRPARAGTSSARRWPRSCSGRRSRSTAAGSTSSSPTTRTSSRSRGRSGIRSRRSGRTTACSSSPARRCRSRSGTSRRSARCSTSGGARRCSCSSSAAHWRKPIDFSTETMAQAAAQAEALPRRLPPAIRAAPPDAWDAVRGGARRRLQHAGGACGACTAGATTSCSRPCARRSSGSARLPSQDEAPPELVALAEQRIRPVRERDFELADRLRDEIEAAGWEMRDEPRRLPLVRRR